MMFEALVTMLALSNWKVPPTTNLPLLKVPVVRLLGVSIVALKFVNGPLKIITLGDEPLGAWTLAWPKIVMNSPGLTVAVIGSNPLASSTPVWSTIRFRDWKFALPCIMVLRVTFAVPLAPTQLFCGPSIEIVPVPPMATFPLMVTLEGLLVEVELWLKMPSFVQGPLKVAWSPAPISTVPVFVSVSKVQMWH